MTAEPEAYYNEHEPHAAQWLRNLIAAGLIPPGVVDERDIRDVTPAELVRFTQCHFFAGIGLWPYALRRSGWPDNRPIWTGSCPCQPFSAAGKGDGFDDERHLWPHWHWLIQNQPPERRPVVILGEQVAGTDGLGWFDLVSDDLGGIGYAVGAVDLSAAGFGVGWRGSAESERLERAIRDCPDPMVARHLAAFADWADQALSIGGFHIRQRLYFVGLAHESGGRWGEFGDAVEPGEGGHLDGGGDAHGGLANSEGVGCAPGRFGSAPGRPAIESDGHRDAVRLANSDGAGAGSSPGNGEGPEGAVERGNGRAPGASAATGHHGPSGRMVHGERPGLQRQREYGDDGHQPGWIGTPADGSAAAAGDVDRVEHAAGVGHHGRADPGSDRSDEGARAEAEEGRAAGLQHAEGTGAAGGVGNRDGDGRHTGQPGDAGTAEGPGREDRAGDAGSGIAGGVGDGFGIGQPARGHGDHAGHDGHQPGADGGGDRPGADQGGGQRGSVDWLLCRDGVWRPAEPGTFPLAHAIAGRVGRLRAYGNGLDLETAQGFVTCVMGMLKDLAAIEAAGDA